MLGATLVRSLSSGTASSAGTLACVGAADTIGPIEAHVYAAMNSGVFHGTIAATTPITAATRSG